MAVYNTIKLKNYLNIFEEFAAYETIIPGMLLELNSDGKVKKHATAGGNVVPPMFALEDFMQGKGIDADADVYVADDKVQVWVPQRGDQVWAILANDQTISIGELLESAGDGTLRTHTVEATTSNDVQEANTIYSQPVVGIALEAMDLTGSSDAGSAGESSVGVLGFTKRIKIMII